MRMSRVPTLAFGMALAEPLEEVVEGVVLGQVRQARDLHVVVGYLGFALNVDADYRRTHFLHEVGKAQRHRPHGGLSRLWGLRGLRRLRGREAHVLAEREPPGA